MENQTQRKLIFYIVQPTSIEINGTAKYSGANTNNKLRWKEHVKKKIRRTKTKIKKK